MIVVIIDSQISKSMKEGYISFRIAHNSCDKGKKENLENPKMQTSLPRLVKKISKIIFTYKVLHYFNDYILNLNDFFWIVDSRRMMCSLVTRNSFILKLMIKFVFILAPL